MKKQRPYVIEIYKPPYSPNPMMRGTKVRVHCGTFEENRDSLSPCMVTCYEVQQHSIKGARARAKEYLAEYERFRRVGLVS